METALALYDRINDPMDAIDRMGEMFSSSGMFGCTKIEQGKVLAIAMMCEKKSPIELNRTYHLIEGKLSMKADAMLAGFRNLGGRVEWKQADDKAAIGIWSIDGTKTEIGFTIADAARAGFIPAKPGSSWTKFPDAMLRARCISKAVRMLTPEVNAGTYTPEEISDFNTQPDPKTITVVTANVQAEPAKPAPAETDSRSFQDRVAEAIKDNTEAVLEWLRKYNWIKAEQGLESLSIADCEKILARPKAFVTTVLNGKAPTGGARA